MESIIIPEEVIKESGKQLEKLLGVKTKQRNKEMLMKVISEKGVTFDAYWEGGEIKTTHKFLSRSPAISSITKEMGISVCRASELLRRIFVRLGFRAQGPYYRVVREARDKLYKRGFSYPETDILVHVYPNTPELLFTEIANLAHKPSINMHEIVFSMMEKLEEKRFPAFEKWLKENGWPNPEPLFAFYYSRKEKVSEKESN